MKEEEIRIKLLEEFEKKCPNKSCSYYNEKGKFVKVISARDYEIANYWIKKMFATPSHK